MTLLSQLTLEEKAALCLGSTFWHTAPIPRLGLPEVMVADGPHGLRRQPDGNQAGISGSLPATCFPTASALGSSWDPDLVRQVGQAIGAEARAQGVSVVLGPGVNIKRSPLCGRNFEYFAEDPLLTGVLGEAYVEGIQSQGVGACVKHFAANNQETDRLRVSADVDERTLREIYLPHFERIVTRSRPWMVMCAYNRVNGVHASQNPWLLTDVLRDEWGFDGVVVSDWGAVHDRVAALNAGLDLEMPPNLGVSDTALVAAVRDGSLDEAVLDRAVERVLRLVERAPTDVRPAEFDLAAHHALAREVAAECAVLLKNNGGLLPLQPSDDDIVAVIGEFARNPRFQGAGSSHVNPTRVDIPLDELRAAGLRVEFAAGDDPAEAVALARRASTVVLFLGLAAGDESEGADREHLDLPTAQTALVEQLAAANPRLVVVLSNGAAVRMTPWDQHVPAILETWLSGQAAGGAVADLLLGASNPSGRLAETLPLRLQDVPSYLNFPGEQGHVRYGEGVFVGYRGYDAVGREVAYPFGHGLSYTTFEYRDLVVGPGIATVTIINTGDRRGKEVVQLYVAAPSSRVARPVRELKAFAKVDLAPGEATTVTFTLDERDLSYWSPADRRWVLEGGTIEVSVGASSRDLRATATLDVPAAPIRPALDADATLREWLADPDGSAALREAVGAGPDGTPNGILGDDETLTVLGDFPLRVLTVFPDLGIDRSVLDKATAGLPF
ncbi:Beta-glucosidase [Micromonospora noduli]|uniref:glycoside hydrolase family 3 C-terminal domain-containing protein n=1 Tax=Micromonospora noduli TaxID=709876 RepID=UPI000DBFA81D|nr:glycoside hydrolase family 3 C-terminal domain-containing protein [Micromonospora noduli]RAO32624.1 Beta-glucosidase [Micromonospora noduli]